jgi:hypothetical protein
MTAFRYGAMIGLVALLELASVSTILAVRWELPVGQQLQSVPTADKPWFCHDLDCPSFTVLNYTDSYEVRRYAPGKWASTAVEGILYAQAITVGFNRLFKYISGENEQNTKIEMTSPVKTYVEAGQGPFCKSTFTVSFYVPSEFQDNPPKPLNPDVFIEDVPENTYYVSQFGGILVDDWSLSSKAKALTSKLDADGVQYAKEGFISAGYDPPFRLQHRHNEIWVWKGNSTEGI